MQSKHSLTYLIGRGFPGIINFFSLALYSRLLSTNEYGKYALIIASIALMNTSLYQWVRLSLLRHLPSCNTEEKKNELYSSVAIGFLLSSTISVLITTLYYLLNDDKIEKIFLLLGLLILWLEAIIELGLENYRSNLQPKKYSITFSTKSLLTIIFGCTFAYLNYGEKGLLYGIVVGDLLVIIIYFKKFIVRLINSIRYFNEIHLQKIIRYGLPFTATFAMTYIFNTSDRFFINYYLGTEMTGSYSIGYDIARQSIWVVMTSINLASFPIALKAMEKNGNEAAREQLKSNFTILSVISIPIAVAFYVLSDKAVYYILGEEFQETANEVVPIIAIGTLIAGYKNFYVDQSFQLGKKTNLQIWPVLIAAIVNVGLNIDLIPRFGVLGSVYSTLVSFGIALISSIYLSRKSFKLPLPYEELLKILFSSIIMGIVLSWLKKYSESIIGLIVILMVGIIIYCLLLISFYLVRKPNGKLF